MWQAIALIQDTRIHISDAVSLFTNLLTDTMYINPGARNNT